MSWTKASAGVAKPLGVSVMILALISLGTAQAVAQTTTSAAQPSKVEPLVRQQIADRGETSFWVVMRETADLNQVGTQAAKHVRGQRVIEQLQRTADQSQAGVRATLKQRGVNFETFWIENTLRVTAGANVLAELEANPQVAQILADEPLSIPEPSPAADAPRVDAVEWGVDRVGAPNVWNFIGVRGENIVVANIDTGVQFNHPALVQQYRGRNNDGTFNHNYNWFDPARVCPGTTPCDNNSHGTHTMGTMVGDDGGANQIGVAPRARWIAAKGCESGSCSRTSLLGSGQWVLAPTDLNGMNPRPDLAPHVVNNSWGGSGNDPFYQATVRAWVAAGIFPSFSNGNSGRLGCGTAGRPANYPESYGVGAFDINNNIADFSSRGPSPMGGIIKPNISAPGVAVRSSVPGSAYGSKSGTSMAAPHLSGAVALVLSAAPGLIGNIDFTRLVLDVTATPVSDLTCGGTPDDNNVWGKGRLDAFFATYVAVVYFGAAPEVAPVPTVVSPNLAPTGR